MILDTLRRIEARGALETAHRCKLIVGQVCRYAITTGRAISDPTRDLRDALLESSGTKYPHITDPVRLGEVLRAIDGYTGTHTVKCALQLLPLVFVRSGELLFPGHRSAERPISNNTLNGALRRQDIPQSEHVAHGFGHTASTLLNERRVEADLIEAQLHHQQPGERGTYNSAKYVELRRRMMQGWADYLDGLKHGAKVIELAAQA